MDMPRHGMLQCLSIYKVCAQENFSRFGQVVFISKKCSWAHVNWALPGEGGEEYYLSLRGHKKTKKISATMLKNYRLLFI